MHVKKQYFFLPPYYYVKSHSKLSKNEPVCMCKEGWCIGLGQVRVVYVADIHFNVKIVIIV